MKQGKKTKSMVVQLRVDEDFFNTLKDIAAAESLIRETYISVAELIRNAAEFMYFDGERLRECFKRSRFRNKSRYH